MMNKAKKKIIRRLIVWLVALIASLFRSTPKERDLPEGSRIWFSMKETETMS